MAQAWPPPKPKLKQEEFDEAVKTNIEDFDMPEDEAIASAVKEFELQGYDVSGVLRSATGTADLDSHPLATATVELRDAVASQAGPAALQASLAAFQASWDEHGATAQAPAVAARASSLQPLLDACHALFSTVSALGSSSSGAAAASGAGSAAAVLESLHTALRLSQQVMACSLEVRDKFCDLYGCEQLLTMLKWCGGRAGLPDTGGAEPAAADVAGLDPAAATGSSDGGTGEETGEKAAAGALAAAIAATAEVACLKEEEPKCKLMENGFMPLLLRLLRHATGAEGQLPPLPLVNAACGCISAVATADDDRPPASKAFLHARMLAKEQSAVGVLLQLLNGVTAALAGIEAGTVAAATEEGTGGGDQGRAALVETCMVVLAALRHVAANEQICKEVSDGGGVTSCVDLLSGSAAASRPLSRSAVLALRQMTNSDAVKTEVVARGGLPVLLRLLALHGDAEDVQEPVLGLLANLTLRMPEIVVQAADAGTMETVVEVMTQAPRRAQVQRQSCILVRNMVVRNTDLRPRFLALGVEQLLRAAKKQHPQHCTDVGSAALRDLGLDDYNT